MQKNGSQSLCPGPSSKLDISVYFPNMLVTFHLVAFVFNELFTPQWQKNVREISREVVAAMREASD